MDGDSKLDCESSRTAPSSALTSSWARAPRFSALSADFGTGHTIVSAIPMAAATT